MVSKRHLALLGLGSALVLAQCAWAGDRRHVAEAPSASELAGSWRPADRFRDPLVLDRPEVLTLTDVELRAATIHLGHDGTCDVKAVPNGFGRFTQLEGEYKHVRCRWSVSTDVTYVSHKRTGVPVVAVEVSAVRSSNGLMTDAPIRLFIGRKKGRLVLWDYLGDPDQEIVLEYTRLP